MGVGLLVLLSPVVERELRVALHRRDARKARSRVARLGVLGVSLFLLFGALTGTKSWGGTLHFFLFLGGLGLAVGPAIQISVGLFAEEREQQTLELLYLTGMGSAELFIGKVVGGALVSSCELMALAPVVAVPFLSGGLSFDLFLATLACLPTVFVLVLAAGTLASVLCKQEGTALVILGVILGALSLALPLPYNLGFWLTGTAPFAKSWLVLSPALGPWMVARNFAGFSVSDFWAWTLVTWAWTVAGLALAAVTLKRNWRRDLERVVEEGWRAKWEAFVHGSAEWRESLRRRVLAANAYQWLVEQDRRPVLQAWGFMASVCAFWLLGWCAWPHVWPSTVNFFSTAIVLLAGIDALVAHAAARQMAADRRDGALELLLTTALGPEEMLNGQRAALRHQFRPVKCVLFGLLVGMGLAGLLTRGWTTPGLVSYLAVWCLLFAWCWRSAQRSAAQAMWVAANCGRPLYGFFRTGGNWNRLWMLYWFWTAANSFGRFGGRARSFPSGTITEMWVTVALVLSVLLVILLQRKASEAMADPLVLQLRLIAQEPVPKRDDPRFKEWKDIGTRFPGPAGGRAGFPGEDVSPAKPIKAAGAWFWRPAGRLCGLAWGKLLSAARKR
jgi:ABC-type transport system involved in cytochrome c biogenesis permease component